MTPMTRITGAQTLVGSLRNFGITSVFGLPGAQLYDLYDAFYDHTNAIRVISARHEQGAGYMALGYAQATGGVGAYMVVQGVGLLNSSAALATAYSSSSRVLCITTQNPVPMIGRGFGLLHEIPDQPAILRSLTKWSGRAEHATEVPALVREAFNQLNSGRPYPVALELPVDVLGQMTVAQPAMPNGFPAPPAPDPELIEQAAALLGKAARPVIFVGGGIHGAAAPLVALAEAIEAPVVMTRQGYGVISDRHYRAQHLPVGHRLWATADVVLAVGTRLMPALTQWGLDAAIKIVRVDIDPKEINRVSRPAVGIHADARLALAALANAVGQHNRVRASRADELNGLKAELAGEYARVKPQTEYLKVIREELPDDGIFVEEITQMGYYARYALPIYHPHTYISSGYQGTLGFGFATALGAKAARPDRKLVAISGDGGFLFTGNELATAVQHGLDVVCIVFNDNAFGNVKRDLVEDYDGRLIGCDLHNPDFVKYAESFGALGLRAASPEALRGALRQAFKAAVPTLIEVPSTGFGDPWYHARFLPQVRPAR